MHFIPRPCPILPILYQLHGKLGLSYKNSRELNAIIDGLPHRPLFRCKEIEIAGGIVTVYSRNIISCIRALYGDPAFAPHLIFKPERHYERSNNQRHRLYHDMHTGDWWWEAQVCNNTPFVFNYEADTQLVPQITLEASKPGATVIPLVVSTDHTQLTLFGNKTAYPLYLTIGNIPKDIRRKPSRHAYMLLAYLPASKLKHITNNAMRRRMAIDLFHFCLSHILEPIKRAAVEGILMKDGHGVIRRVHPILASYIGDYPEQVIVTCTKTGECPKCDISANDIGSLDKPCQLRDHQAIHAALRLVDADPQTYREACKLVRIKPVFHPFWESLPYVNIFQSITPDILHQLHQGVLKHLISWLVQAYGAREIDARCQRLIPNHHIRVFSSGITGLSRLTGKERDLISRILLGTVIGAHLANDFEPSRMIRVVRAFLDFLYLARLPLQSSKTLHLLDQALQSFHDNKSIFVDMGIRENFKIPKIHACRHYASSIKLFGTVDNYNTQQTERLHIDFAKEGYRASNTKDELPQMTAWMDKQEKLNQHTKYIHWRLHGDNQHHITLHQTVPKRERNRCIKMTRKPTVQSVSIETLETNYGASSFREAFARFIIQWQIPGIRQAHLNREAQGIHLPFTSVSTYHRIKFQDADVDTPSIVDAIHVQPEHYVTRRCGPPKTVPGRFDTVLVRSGREGDTTGIKGELLIHL